MFSTIILKLQSDFYKGHSAQHCLLALIEKRFLDKRGFAGLLLTDLSKLSTALTMNSHYG